MTEERDPHIQSLFANTDADLPDDGFTARVMTDVRRRRNRHVFAKITAGILLIAGAIVLLAPLHDAVPGLSAWLTVPLFALDNPWLTDLLAPLNSVAAVCVAGLAMLRFAYKRVFG